MILVSFPINDEEIEMTENDNLNSLDSDEFQILYNQFLNYIENFRKNAPTVKLWLQYYDIVNIRNNSSKANDLMI